MNCLTSQLFVLTVFLFNSILSQKICNLTDIECTTRGAKNIYKTILGAFKDESPDPLYRHELQGKLATLEYNLSNITLTGMSKCEVILLICRQEEGTFDYNLRCPQLELKSNYEAKGSLGTLQIDGKGKATIIANDYVIKLKGDYGRFISEEDQKPHVFVKSFKLDTEPEGKVTFDLDNLISGNKEKADLAKNFLNQNGKEMVKMFQNPIIDLFQRFYENFFVALKTFPLYILLPHEEK